MPGGQANSRRVNLWGVEIGDAGLLMSGALEPRPRGSWWNDRHGLLGFEVLAKDSLGIPSRFFERLGSLPSQD